MRLKVQGSARFRAAAQQLRQAGRVGLRREMVKEMRAAGREIIADQRAEVRRLDVTGQRFHRSGTKRQVGADGRVRQVRVPYRRNTRSTGLRDRVARSLALEVKTSGAPRVRFVSKREKMPAGQENLPRHLDNPKGWRHPVFGNREMWVAQRGGSWFWPPIKKKIRVFRERLDQAVTRTVEKIERG
ncbi:hypothetical protein [Micromonospora sp. NPDC048063]|uniref:hypothetical protein n=1 Tax=Micromonospora sp. NPDC048063 TaxID=3364256 RepID=UPI00371FCD7A